LRASLKPFAIANSRHLYQAAQFHENRPTFFHGHVRDAVSECWSLVAKFAAATGRIEVGTFVRSALPQSALLGETADTVEAIGGGRHGGAVVSNPRDSPLTATSDMWSAYV